LAAVMDELQAGRLHAAALVDPVVERCIALARGKPSLEPQELRRASRIIECTAQALARSGLWPDVSTRPSASLLFTTRSSAVEAAQAQGAM